MKTLMPLLSLDEWTRIMQTLEEDITRWSQEQGWQVNLREAGFMQDYPREFIPRTLTITTPKGRLMLETPDHESDGRGRAKLYAWPTLYRVWLRHSEPHNTWEIWTDSGIPIRLAWEAKTFITLANDLLDADE
jgi:hypothetical protein